MLESKSVKGKKGKKKKKKKVADKVSRLAAENSIIPGVFCLRTWPRWHGYPKKSLLLIVPTFLGPNYLVLVWDKHGVVLIVVEKFKGHVCAGVNSTKDRWSSAQFLHVFCTAGCT